MNFSRGVLSAATIILLLGAAGAATWWRLRPAEDAETAGADGDTAAVSVESASTQFASDVPTPVSGAEVIRDTLWITVRASGRAEAYRRTTIAAQSQGAVQTVPVRENTRVAAGDVLVQIDTTELALAVAQERAGLADAQANYQAALLFDDQIDDPEVRRQREQVARSSSGLNAAEVRLRQAEIALERATVRAPWGGRIADLHVVPGQYVTTGTELLTVVDLDPIKVEVNVLEAELGYLSEGRRAVVTFAAFPGEEFVGAIETINPVVDPEARTGRVTVLLANSDGRIKPGMYAEVTLDAEALPDVLMVPRSAILERGQSLDRQIVFLYEEQGGRGLSKWQYVNTGAENEEYVEILPADDGTMLEAGQIVLTQGHHYLSHDTVIRLVENPAAEGGRPTR